MTMKKLIAMVLCIVLILLLVGCEKSVVKKAATVPSGERTAVEENWSYYVRVCRRYNTDRKSTE